MIRQRRFFFTDPKLRRHIEFRLVKDLVDLRGKEWNGYVELPMSGMSGRSGAAQRRLTIEFLNERHIQEWLIEHTGHGPILTASNGKQLLRS